MRSDQPKRSPQLSPALFAVEGPAFPCAVRNCRRVVTHLALRQSGTRNLKERSRPRGRNSGPTQRDMKVDPHSPSGFCQDAFCQDGPDSGDSLQAPAGPSATVLSAVAPWCTPVGAGGRGPPAQTLGLGVPRAAGPGTKTANQVLSVISWGPGPGRAGELEPGTCAGQRPVGPVPYELASGRSESAAGPHWHCLAGARWSRY